MQILDQF